MFCFSVHELARRDAADVIDVRTPAEYREVHAEVARNVPLESLDPHAVMNNRQAGADQPLYVMCRSGNRSTQACKKFLDAGYDQIVNVDGGTKAWEEAGLPVRRGQKTISLERQVRIAAGLLVLIGAVLGYFLHPGFIAISAFVGAGLMFAGITDTCGMAMVLARMPWNQTAAASDSTARGAAGSCGSGTCATS
jgi:rhodanese-related sulfurtransferase